MRLRHQTSGVVLLLAVLAAPWRIPAQELTSAKVPDPMAGLARMASGVWQVTFLNGKSQFDTWNWGPGKHSMRVQTHGSGGAGEPWRALEVMYWHPGHKQVRLLGLSPYAQGMMEGSMSFEGDTAYAVFDLYQTGRRRKLSRRWSFHGPDEYRATLWEETGTAGLAPLGEWTYAPVAEWTRAPLAEWTYVRSKTLAQADPHTDEEAPEPSKHLRALESLVGHIWEVKGDWAAGDAFHIQSTVAWVPYADFIYARSIALNKDGESAHLLDAYVYHHPETGGLRCLALSKWGGVYEGDLTVLEGGVLQLDLKGYEGDQAVPHVVRFDFEKDGTLRDRIWSLKGTERTLILDIHHEELKPMPQPYSSGLNQPP